MIKLAVNRDNPNLVFLIDEVVRVPLAGGIVEYYKGTLKDTSTKPDTSTENYTAQVMAFESKWAEIPVDVAGTGNNNNQANKDVTPTASKQEVTPDSGYTGLDKVTVAAAPVEAAQTAELSVVEDVTLTPGTGKVGLASVTVPRVTAAIDANIVAGNIKHGVTILGVEGTYTGDL